MIRGFDAALRDKQLFRRHERAQLQAVVQTDGEILEVAVVDTDDVCAGIQCRAHLRLVVRFHDGGESEIVTDPEIVMNGFGIQKGADQQDGGCTQNACLINLIRVNRKILAQHRSGYGRGDFLEVEIRALEVFRLGEDGNCGCTCGLVISCDVQIGEVIRNHALGRGSALDLADEAHTLRGEVVKERRASADREGACLFAHQLRRYGFLFLCDTRSRAVCQCL